jgi:hypothetical protein
MTEGRRKAVVFAVLIVAVIWGIYNNPFSTNKKPSAGSTVDQPSVYATERPVQSDQAVRSSRYADLKDWKADPFHRNAVPRSTPNGKVEAGPYFHLSAISRSDRQSMAIINGRVVGEDGEIDGWAVAEIGDNSVVLSKGSEEIELKLRRR